MSHYHNTVKEGVQLSIAHERRAATQDELVYQVMGELGEATPSEVWRRFPGVPITSIRRAMSNLTKDGRLKKTKKKKVGIHGRNEKVWTLMKASYEQPQEQGQ